MTRAKTLIVLALTVFAGGNMFGQCADLFFSEYVEGSSNNKAIEVYNPTGAAIDLADYEIHRFNNGATTSPYILDMEGMIGAFDVFVAANPSAANAFAVAADTLDAITFYNGDDALLLIYVPTADTLDVIGELGIDPGSNWTVGTGATSEFTLVRMATVGGGSNDWAANTMTWDVLPQNDSSSIGSHMSNCESASTACSELFFSEYIEGSSSNKAIEVYNPTAGMVDLEDYEIHRFNNGATTNPDILDMQGMLAGYDVFTAVNPNAIAVFQAQADTLDDITFFNGDDALLLINSMTGDTLDVIGNFGEDPGSNWPVDTGSTANYTLVRMQSVDGGTDDWSVGADTWIAYGINDSAFFGSHVSNCEILASGCDGIFFSEYIEGSGNNKALEIYNASSASIDLTSIQIHRFNNGGNMNPDTFDIQGMVAPYDVYVVANGSADPAILAVADTTGSATFYNGDDYLLLIDISTNDTLDAIGEFGVDPGSSWTVGSGATGEFTLVRMFNVTEGTGDWTVGETQWNVFPQNTFGNLGEHDNVCAPPSSDTEVSFAAGSAIVSEGDGSVSFDIEIENSMNDTVAVDVTVMMSSTATNGTDYMFMDTTVVFAANASMPVTLSAMLTDDTDLESDETIVLLLSNATNGALIGSDSIYTITIEDNDYPVYPIGLITADADNDGSADSLGVRCEVRGLVYGVNLSSSGVQFALRDSTDGVQVFSFSVVSGYVVAEGDSLVVQGSLSEFNGLAQMNPDSIFLASSGNAIADAVVVTALGEETESEWVQFNCVTLVDASIWPADGDNSNVEFTNGVDTFSVRIDKETEIDGTPAPVGYVNLRGIGAQFDSNTPALGGYQLFPQTLADLMAHGAETADLSTDTDATDESAGTYTFSVYLGNANPDSTMISLAVDASSTATEGTDFTVDAFSYDLVGCKDADSVMVTVTITDDADVEGDETIVLVLSSSDTATAITTSTLTLTITETDNIRDLLPAGLVKAYPNPGQDFIRIESDVVMSRATLINLSGQTVRASEETTQQIDMNTTDLPAGIYLLQVETVDGVWMQRWVKQ